jgi:hypothetical protein
MFLTALHSDSVQLYGVSIIYEAINIFTSPSCLFMCFAVSYSSLDKILSFSETAKRVGFTVIP